MLGWAVRSGEAHLRYVISGLSFFSSVLGVVSYALLLVAVFAGRPVTRFDARRGS